MNQSGRQSSPVLLAEMIATRKTIFKLRRQWSVVATDLSGFSLGFTNTRERLHTGIIGLLGQMQPEHTLEKELGNIMEEHGATVVPSTKSWYTEMTATWNFREEKLKADSRRDTV